KGTADIEGTKAGAKRVFLVNEINGLNLTIGVGGTGFTSFSRPINLSEGGSVKNWVNEINDDEVKDFFDTNDVEINAEVGGHPTGLIRFKNIADGDNLTGTNTGTIKLTIGKGTGAYSNTVTLFDVDNDTSTETTDDDTLPDPKPFSSDNKKAITYVDSNSDRLLEDIAETLISAFPPFFESDGTTIAEDEQRPDVAAHVPYGVSNLHDAGGDEDETYTAIVGVLDAQRIAANIDVKIDNKIKGGNAGTILKVASGKNAKIRQVNIKNNPNTIQITLTSKVAGEDETTIGVPVEETGGDEDNYTLPTPPTSIEGATGATVFGTGTIVELPIGDDNPRKSSLPKAGTDDAGAQTRGGAEFDRLGWL
ncbi:MAG: hypothetical protein OXC92_02945, partial [Flavobacteriaceae bacterium]|nr:hypothetical protein [Flavobacteriaceae bacterium]